MWETLLVSGFSFYVAGHIENTLLAIALQSGTLTVAIIYELYGYKKRGNRRKLYFYVGLVVLGLVGLGLMIASLAENGALSITTDVFTTVILLGVSLMWCPKAQKRLFLEFESAATTHDGGQYQGRTEYGSTGDDNSKPIQREQRQWDGDGDENTSIRDERTKLIQSNETTSLEEEKKVNRRWKVGIITGFTRILFVFVWMAISIAANMNDLGVLVSPKNFIYEITDLNFNTASFVNIFTCLASYFLAWLSCATKTQRGTLSFPLVLSNVAIFLVLLPCWSDSWKNALEGIGFTNTFYSSGPEKGLAIAASFTLLVYQSIFCFLYASLPKMFPLMKEEQLFIQPFYSSCFQEQFLVLNRKVLKTREQRTTEEDTIKRKAKVYLCTTMYQESESEQRRLLSSIKKVAKADANTTGAKNKQNGKKPGRLTMYEAHIFFDGGAKGKNVNQYVLQLMHLIQEEMKIKLQKLHLKKIATPYGIQFKIDVGSTDFNIPFFIHVKDNSKVKRKKRWSQVMYMTYIIYYLIKKQLRQSTSTEDSSVDLSDIYLLTTDGDVSFERESVEELIDVLQRDELVGGVCGRTHPSGSGPIAWYQVFDYAISHWFQKAAEHVLGSVMCCPGCFSLFRIKAIKSVLATYRSNVEKSFEFLQKDMGEDRWLSLLLVQAGWRLEYCAAAKNETHCPTSFDEFFKQRRRWIPSTIVNLGKLCSDGADTARRNDNVSLLFILYQAVLWVSGIIAPSTVILIVSAGFAVTYNINEIAIVVIFLIVSVLFGFICFVFPQKVQWLVAKFLTFVFAILMGAVVIGIIYQAVVAFKQLGDPKEQLNELSNTTPTPMSEYFGLRDVPVSTWYVLALSGIYLATAILHPFEFTCVFHSIWYLLCLPSGYLLLIIYAICNLDDQGWGTRETSGQDDSLSWERFLNSISRAMRKLCWCCRSDEQNNDDQEPGV